MENQIIEWMLLSRMTIEHCYKTLKIRQSATDSEISASYKRLAQVYHPDKNPDKIEWANEAMKNLNVAYNTIISHRFRTKSSTDDTFTDMHATQEKPVAKDKEEAYPKDVNADKYIDTFVQIRERAKDSLYRYFQYGLNNIARRDNAVNRGIYNDVVYSLRKSYHLINTLMKKTNDKELLDHFTVFNAMIFNFYKASECVNLIDSYNNKYEVEAYRIYMKGDERLHYAHKEIFFDRHNRGSFKTNILPSLMEEAEFCFNQVINRFSGSTWVLESSIKLEYLRSLIAYLNLFFSEDE